MINSVDDIDELIEHNEVTFDDVDKYNLTSPSCQFDVDVGKASKNFKNRSKVSLNNNTEFFGTIYSATDRLAEVLLQCENQFSSKDNELLEHLVEITAADDDELLNA